MSNLGEEKLPKGDAYKVADALYKFWEQRFPEIFNLMMWVNEVGRFAGYFERLLIDINHYWTTVQDYVKTENVKISIKTRENHIMYNRGPL